jgi:NAD(P)-dependent dehydrogenase (short-subunit alcohol dehydrogenase family)
MLLEDRVAIVSGSGPGIGRAAARALAREGANVVLGARREDGLQKVSSDIEGLGRKAVAVRTDITVIEDCRALADAAMAEFGRIDILVNNAFMQPPMKPIEETSEEEWLQAYNVNVLGSLNMTNAVLPAMKEQRSGSVVFVNTQSARMADVNLGAYSATKSALLTVARTLAREVGEHGIRVNSVVPAHVWGPSLKYYFNMLAEEEGTTPEAIYERVAADSCLKHIPDSAEVADAIVFFASDLARAVTGQSLYVNAGQWLE